MPKRGVQSASVRLMKFSNETCKRLRSYVYALVDPKDKHVFYIGKGKNNRVFDHVNEALKQKSPKKGEDSKKISKIKEITGRGDKVRHYILRHGLSEEIADELESILIDLLILENLGFKRIITNINRGKKYDKKGARSVEEIEELFAPAIKFNPKDKILCLNIAKSFSPERPVYEAAKEAWALNKNRRNKVTHILAVSNGIVRGVFKPKDWYDVDGKTVGFTGEELIDSPYLHKSVKGKVDLKRRAFRYVNV